MKPLAPDSDGRGISLLCLGAHADDIEIGAGGTILNWLSAGACLDVHWCVLSAPGPRAAEAETSAADYLNGAHATTVEIARFRDGYFPYQGGEIKDWVESLKARISPDIILTHRSDDAHQDHREVSQITRSVFRDHLILEYEIPKWDGDLGQPNLYVPIDELHLERKIDLLIRHFGSQRPKDWFDAETFRGLARIRGMECRSPHHYAEAFLIRKFVFALAHAPARPPVSDLFRTLQIAG